MHDRCYNPNNPNYHRYGGRGITVCDEWVSEFENFYSWAIKTGYSELLTIDRIDNNKGYAPNNCRWVTIAEQQRNKRSNYYIECEGTKHTITEWSRILGVTRHSIKYWIEKFGGDAEKAIIHYIKKKGIVL